MGSASVRLEPGIDFQRNGATPPHSSPSLGLKLVPALALPMFAKQI